MNCTCSGETPAPSPNDRTDKIGRNRNDHADRTLEHGLDLVVVDYLQLVSGSGRRFENRTQEVTEISRGLKNLAKELDVPVIAASQLNREVEKRSGSRRPQLSDLRESGSIEQDSDVVLFISRDDMTADDGTAEITVAKHRNGATGGFGLAFARRFTKFRNLQPEGSEWRSEG